MDVVLRPIQTLQAYGRNSRTHSDAQVASLAASLKEYGWTNPVLVDGDGVIVAGHGRVLAARKLGMTEVPTISLAHLSPKQRRAYVVADNKLGLQSGWDKDMLAAELSEMRELGVDLSLTGFDLNEILALIDGGASKAGKTDDDAVPEVPSVPVTRPGDVWVMGGHRLMCGDSTSAESVGVLMAGGLADLLLTDPPYNVDYTGGTKAALKIENDKMSASNFRAFLAAAFSAAAGAMKPGAAFYIWHADSEGLNFRAACLEVGLQVRQCLVWKKQTFVLGRQDYQWKHEPCLYGWKDGARHRWFGGRKQTTVVELATDSKSPFVRRADGRWEVTVGDRSFLVDGEATVEEIGSSVLEFDKPARNDVHPTMKPVALFESQLVNNTRTGDVVLDDFGGSGTTLIAAEKHGRLARVMELSPHYCDVIVQRWQAYTGESAVLEATQRRFVDVALERAE